MWIDGQYVGYVGELKENKKVLLLPGEHEISVRQSGYRDLTQKVVVEPGKGVVVHVTMEKDPRSQFPTVTSQIKLQVTPERAAVFLDDGFAGTVQEFGGIGRGMLVSPGKHRVKIALPGYQAFETEVNLSPHQKITIKTNLVPEASRRPALRSKKTDLRHSGRRVGSKAKERKVFNWRRSVDEGSGDKEGTEPRESC